MPESEGVAVVGLVVEVVSAGVAEEAAPDPAAGDALLAAVADTGEAFVAVPVSGDAGDAGDAVGLSATAAVAEVEAGGGTWAEAATGAGAGAGVLEGGAVGDVDDEAASGVAVLCADAPLVPEPVAPAPAGAATACAGALEEAVEALPVPAELDWVAGTDNLVPPAGALAPRFTLVVVVGPESLGGDGSAAT